MTRKLFQKYDEETEQWLLQDIRDWPIDKFEITADERDKLNVATAIIFSIGLIGFFACIMKIAIVFAENLPFLKVASQFTHKMQRQDRTKVVRYLQQNSSAFKTFSTSSTIGEFQIFILHVITFKLNCSKLP